MECISMCIFLGSFRTCIFNNFFCFFFSIFSNYYKATINFTTFYSFPSFFIILTFVPKVDFKYVFHLTILFIQIFTFLQITINDE